MSSCTQPAFEEAVLVSLICRLPLELRIMIYELLLLQDDGIAIPTTYPDQADNSKDGTDPMSRERCKLFFWNRAGIDRRLHGGHCLIHPLLPVVAQISQGCLSSASQFFGPAV